MQKWLTVPLMDYYLVQTFRIVSSCFLYKIISPKRFDGNIIKRSVCTSNFGIRNSEIGIMK